MNLTDFKTSLQAARPPENMSVYLEALWYDAKGDWDKAHHLVDSLEDKQSCWVHAYLHRKEGDNGNAGYWYRKAGKQVPSYPLEKEWEEIATAFL